MNPALRCDVFLLWIYSAPPCDLCGDDAYSTSLCRNDSTTRPVFHRCVPFEHPTRSLRSRRSLQVRPGARLHHAANQHDARSGQDIREFHSPRLVTTMSRPRQLKKRGRGRRAGGSGRVRVRVRGGEWLWYVLPIGNSSCVLSCSKRCAHMCRRYSSARQNIGGRVGTGCGGGGVYSYDSARCSHWPLTSYAYNDWDGAKYAGFSPPHAAAVSGEVGRSNVFACLTVADIPLTRRPRGGWGVVSTVEMEEGRGRGGAGPILLYTMAREEMVRRLAARFCVFFFTPYMSYISCD